LRETFVRGSILVENIHQSLQICIKDLVNAIYPHVLDPELS
jgi:hypothetical protein